MGSMPAMNSSEIDLYAFMIFFSKSQFANDKKLCLTLYMLENISSFCCCLLAFFSKKFFQEHYQSAKWFADKYFFLNGWPLNSKLFQLQFYSINDPYRMYPKWRNHFKNNVEKVMSIMCQQNDATDLPFETHVLIDAYFSGIALRKFLITDKKVTACDKCGPCRKTI